MPLFKAGNDFKDRYRSYTSDYLIKMVTTDKSQYEAETIQAAEAILQERRVNYKNLNQQAAATVVKTSPVVRTSPPVRT